MEACLVITNNNKPKNRENKILIINALKEVEQHKNIAFLKDEHIEKIFSTYREFIEIDSFSTIVGQSEVLENKGSLNIAQYVSNVQSEFSKSFKACYDEWIISSKELDTSISTLFKTMGL
jgi:type I restriction enzyme M protein